MSAAAAMVAAAALAGCGTTTYFAGRNLPPSGIANRVLIAIQNPSSLTKGELEIVDAYYDIRYSYDYKTSSFIISGYAAALPETIQNMPEEQVGAVYSSGDGSLTMINYASETSAGGTSGLNGLSSSIFVTRNQHYTFAASQETSVLTVVDNTTGGGTFPLSLPGVYRVSVNPGGSVALAFVQNSDYIYYPVKMTAAQTIAYSGGPSNWPQGAEDCQPHNAPTWCLFQARDSSNTALSFNRPVKAIFSADGGTAYILNCGQECGGTQASVSLLPVSPMIFLPNLKSGQLPAAGSVTTINTPGGASNALLDSSTLYVVGQRYMPDGFWGGYLSMIDLSTNALIPSTSQSPNPVSISDGEPGTMSRMILADDNTMWIGMTRCNNGERYNNPSTYTSGYGCLTMFNTANNTVTKLEPYIGDATGIAAVTSLHKIYTAEGGQVYIYSTVDGTAINNEYVAVTGTAYDVAYMDALTDGDNTVY